MFSIPAKKKSIGIKHVADAAGVSISTVSAVMNNNIQKIRISETTKNKVLAAARELNYQPNVYARKLAKDILDENIPVLCVFWETNGFHLSMKEFIEGIKNYISDTGHKFEYLICPFEQDHLEEKKWLLFSNLYRGMIFVGLSRKDEQFLQAAHADIDVPVVLFNREETDSNSVAIDNYNVGRTAANVLLRHRPCSIAKISVDYLVPHRPDSIRTTAFTDECRAAGFPADHIYYITGQDTISGGYFAAEELFRKCQFPCGLFVSNSSMLTGVMRCIEEHTLRIPEDILLVIYGKYEAENIFSQVFTMTNISPPVASMSYDCLSIIDHLLRLELKEKQMRVYQGILRYGYSCPEIRDN